MQTSTLDFDAIVHASARKDVTGPDNQGELPDFQSAISTPTSLFLRAGSGSYFLDWGEGETKWADTRPSTRRDRPHRRRLSSTCHSKKPSTRRRSANNFATCNRTTRTGRYAQFPEAALGRHAPEAARVAAAQQQVQSPVWQSTPASRPVKPGFLDRHGLRGAGSARTGRVLAFAGTHAPGL
ncbi:hypothetical protein E4U53_000605 [Claviceps sorghi]|nr:hypothetical protein E4U53_000605 [Claviceps sorghi]